ncbi:hypothetical protein LOK74_05000 [Brevibacillus humidisoli]|uniref:TolB family protein n=1 Tax=Brevibacillus humidisoli TaxID=2895522 RepID=UPI001E58C921|nr:hypothetical protein [Brevibacillus humidisoli]UFJ41863.1 hypothetical protein LOK74_05000 [Brevibacillus humidisoli]
MKKKRVHGWMAAALLASSFWVASPAHAESIGREVEIKPSLAVPSDKGIDLSREYAVWINENDDDDAIVLYDVDEEEVAKEIVGDGTRKTSPKVSGDYVAWIDFRHGDGAVYLYDLDREREIRVTDSSANVVELDFEGDTVVWVSEHGDKTDVYAYSIEADESKQVSYSGAASHPTVHGSYVAWEDDRNGHADIYAYDLSTDEEIRATTNSYDQTKPSLYKDIIIYEDDRNGNTELYQYDLDRDDEDQVTDGRDDRENPKVYGDIVVYENDGDLEYYNMDDDDEELIERKIETKIGYAIYGDYVLYAKEDSDVMKLYLYDIDEDEEASIGLASKPGQPDADDWHIVYISDSGTDGVVLYNVETESSMVISDEDQDPSRPLVSGNWVIYYDQEEDALFSYSIKSGKRKQVTDEDVASDELYELNNNQLVWVEDDTIYLTNLSTGDTRKIDELYREPKRIDINDEYILWLTDEGRNTSDLYLYDLDEQKGERIRRGEIGHAALGEEFVIWSEMGDDNWDLFYYQTDRDRIYSLFRNNDGDQIRPQASRNFIIYEDNRYTNDENDYLYQLYDLEDFDYVESLSAEAVPTELRMGGNRIVWIDEREEEEALYMMSFAQPRDEMPEEPEEPGNEDGEYVFWDIIHDGSFVDIFNDHPWDKVYLVFYANTDDEFEVQFFTFVENSKAFLDHINATPRDKFLVRVYD